MVLGFLKPHHFEALEGQDLPRTYLAHHEPACVIIIIDNNVIVIL